MLMLLWTKCFWVPGLWIILTGDPGHRPTLLFCRSGEDKWLPQDYRVNVSAPKALHSCAHPPDLFRYSPHALNSATVLSVLQPFHSLININMHLKKGSSGNYPHPHTEGSLGAPESSHSHRWELQLCDIWIKRRGNWGTGFESWHQGALGHSSESL